AQQRQILHENAISPNHGKIRPNAEYRPGSIGGNAFELEHAGSSILTESHESELHLHTPYRNLRSARSRSYSRFSLALRRVRSIITPGLTTNLTVVHLLHHPANHGLSRKHQRGDRRRIL